MKQEYLAFIENGTSANLPEPVEQLELFELVKLYQIPSHSRTRWKYKKNKCLFPMVEFLQIEQ